jgi:hypothetical protein
MASIGDPQILHRRGDVLAGTVLPGQPPRLWPTQVGGLQMKTFKNIVLILCLSSLCSKAVVLTYRHFHPAPVAVVGP